MELSAGNSDITTVGKADRAKPNSIGYEAEMSFTRRRLIPMQLILNLCIMMMTLLNPSLVPSPSLPLVDLDEFVECHLFGSDLSPPLIHSCIHETSDNWTSFNR